MGSVDRWPLAIVRHQIPEGRPSVVSAVRRRDLGRDPSPEGRMLQPRAPRHGGARTLRRTVPGDLSGGNRMAGILPRCAVVVKPVGRFDAPSVFYLQAPPSRAGVSLPPGCSREKGTRGVAR